MVADTVSVKGALMIKGTPELIAGRREEIINACEKLYQTMSFKEITLKEIGNVVPFSRPTIYNYFQTKDEIFLALFGREYDRWNKDLTAILDGQDSMTREQLADAIAASLGNRPQLLKLLSMNNYDMEANSRQELLTEFKKSYGCSLQLVSMLVQKFCPEMSVSDIQNFIYIFFPFMFGIYPYTEVTEKQRNGMKEAGVNYVYQTAYELIYNCLIRLLGE
ncbi:MAG: TetR family transcriptional regulator [Solobacterium sp.]|nr:TetR family transcriptional regulator [Solobacterium sp.]